jgi:hypothetical protein
MISWNKNKNIEHCNTEDTEEKLFLTAKAREGKKIVGNWQLAVGKEKKRNKMISMGNTFRSVARWLTVYEKFFAPLFFKKAGRRRRK